MYLLINDLSCENTNFNTQSYHIQKEKYGILLSKYITEEGQKDWT